MVSVARCLSLLLGQGLAEGGALDGQNDGCAHDDRFYWTSVHF